MVILMEQLRAAENMLNKANEEIAYVKMAIRERVREAIEDRERAAFFFAEMEKKESEAREHVQQERNLNVGLSTTSYSEVLVSKYSKKYFQELMSFKTDLDALWRILPVAAGHIRTVELAERQLLEEEMITAYLVRNEVGRTFIEVPEKREVRLSVIVEGTNKLRKGWFL
ncbi:hypothetical protein Y032_0001g85 [Ancylostoma ceylanicum]|uniref:Uncharacterized protein n=1 Tax=Ancylostoma ceylanicum TaxID=53326 RepID=A0A016W4A2_9BILA|nr:hypothetical protein Y032_0001g85 [Ancylostoma ceylanicum]